eukprot:3208406-Alexandrium_andersonii.AAC.1
MALAPLSGVALRLPWAGRLLATDASEWGRGVAQKDVSPELAASAGRVSERWRFARGAGSARSHALGPEGLAEGED